MPSYTPSKICAMEPCDHVGFHSGRTRYDHVTEQLRCVIVCDACEAELREVEILEYRPQYEEPEGPPLAA